MPFQPTDIAGCKLWLKADSLSLNDGDAVGTWADQSGNGHDATQVTPGKRPLFKTGIQNGQPVVRFDNVDDFLQTSFTTPQPVTVFTVAKDSITGRMICDGITGSARNVIFASNSKYQSYAGTQLLGTVAINSAFHLLSAVFNGVSSLIRADGVETDGNAGTQNSDGWTIGNNYTFTATLNGDIAEFIVYNSALSAANIQLVEAYLSAKYNIGITTNWSWTVAESAPNAEAVSLNAAPAISEVAPSPESLSLSATMTNAEVAPSPEALFLSVNASYAEDSLASESFEAEGVGATIFFNEVAPTSEGFSLAAFMAMAESVPGTDSASVLKWSPAAKVAAENRTARVAFEDRSTIVPFDNRRTKA